MTAEEKLLQANNLIKLLVIIILIMGVGFGILNYKYQTTQLKQDALFETLLLSHNVTDGVIEAFNACSKGMEEVTNNELNCGYITPLPSIDEVKRLYYDTK